MSKTTIKHGLIELMAREISLIGESIKDGNYADLKGERRYCALRQILIEDGGETYLLDENFKNATGLIVSVKDRANTLLGGSQ